METKRDPNMKEQKKTTAIHDAPQNAEESRQSMILANIIPRDDDYTGSECDTFNDR